MSESGCRVTDSARVLGALLTIIGPSGCGEEDPLLTLRVSTYVTNPHDITRPTAINLGTVEAWRFENGPDVVALTVGDTCHLGFELKTFRECGFSWLYGCYFYEDKRRWVAHSPNGCRLGIPGLKHEVLLARVDGEVDPNPVRFSALAFEPTSESYTRLVFNEEGR